MSIRSMFRKLEGSMAAVTLALLVVVVSRVSCKHSLAEEKARQNSKAAGATMGPAMAEGYPIQPLPYNEIRPRGLVADRIELNLARLVRDEKRYDEMGSWGADQIARWIGTVSVHAALTGRDLDAEIDPKVQRLIASLDERGIFCGDRMPTPRESGRWEWGADRERMVWFGHGRGLWNLLEHYHISGGPQDLAALKRAADGTLASRELLNKWFPGWGDKNARWSMPVTAGVESAVGAMVVLWQKTGKKEYLDYARHIADNITRLVAQPMDDVLGAAKIAPPAGSQDHLLAWRTSDLPYSHVYTYLAIAHGMVDLAVATGEQKYLAQAKKVFEDTLPSVWLNGSFPECYGYRYEFCDETCGIYEWVLLGLKLFDATGERRYLDAAELSILNGLLSDQDYRGGFACYRCLDRRAWVRKETNWGDVAWACCNMSGGLGLGHAAAHVVTKTRDGLSINLPLEVDIRSERNGRPVKLSQKVQVGSTELTQKLSVNNGGKTPLHIKIRIPYWCQAPLLRVDGRKQPPEVSNGFASVRCRGRSSRKIDLALPMRLQVIPARENALTLGTAGASGKATEQGLQYGPFVLMFHREIHKQVTGRDIAVTIPLDEGGHPTVHQDVPQNWRAEGAIPLFVKAQLAGGSEVFLTPCANTTMALFSVADPYVLRFRGITIAGP